MLTDVQDQVDRWTQTLAKPYWEPLSQFAALAEEVGEVGRLMNDMYGDKPKKLEEAKQELGGELADVLFAAICIANKHDINLDEAFAQKMEKCRTRDKDRFAKKDTA